MEEGIVVAQRVQPQNLAGGQWGPLKVGVQIASVVGGQGAATGKAAEGPVREVDPCGVGVAAAAARTGCCKPRAGEE